jgi:hypothetical protein
MDKYDTV